MGLFALRKKKDEDKKRFDYRLPFVGTAILCLALAGWLLYPAIVGDGDTRQPTPSPSAAAPHVQQTLSPEPNYTLRPSYVSTPGPGANTNTHFRVSIIGNVMYPGEYYVNKGETLADIIERAGGLTEGADTSGLVMDKPLYDGEYIEIP